MRSGTWPVIYSNILIYLGSKKFGSIFSSEEDFTSVNYSWSRSLKFHYESRVGISQAFDTLWHSWVFFELSCYSIPSKLCAWIYSFLSNGRISVAINGHQASFHLANSGVPQGLVFAPNLFFLNINYSLQLLWLEYSSRWTAVPRSYLELRSNLKTVCTNLSKDFESLGVGCSSRHLTLRLVIGLQKFQFVIMKGL